jgi:predicted nucleotidyltransferase
MGYDSGMDDVLARLHVTQEQIAAFCRKWAIVRFELFGSALRADFDEQSDVDVLVTFGPEGKSGIGELLDMEDELQILFGRHTDLVERHLIETSRNWVRRRNILQSAQVLYAAA